MIALKYGKRKVINYRGARMVVGGLTSKNKIDILLYMAKELASTQNQKDLFDRVILLSEEIFEVDNVTLRIWQDDKLVPIAFLKQTDPPRRELAIGEGYSGTVFKERKSMNLENLEFHPDYLDERETTRCAMVAPILLREEGLGTIAIEKDIPDFYTKDDLEILEAMAAQLALALNEVKLVEGLVAARHRLDSDLRMGRSVQSQIIPTNILPWNSIRFAHYFEPMVEVSGDYFDVMRSGNSLTCIIADVSGHGVPAALVTMALHSQFRRCVDQGFGLPEMMAELNESMREKLPDGTYFTAQLARIYADHTFSYVNGGHVRIMHYVQKQKDFEFLDTKGFPLGIMPARRSDYEEKFGKLEQGDMLVFLTDGFHEQRNLLRQDTGFPRVLDWFREILREVSDPVVVRTEFMAVWNDFVEGAPREDDLTLLVLECSPNLDEARENHKLAKQHYFAGRVAEAEKAALEAYRLDSSLHDNLLFLSKLYHNQENFPEAVRFMGEYISTSGANKPEYYHALGTLQFRKGDVTAAKRDFKKSLSLDHTYAKSSLMLAKCYLKEGSRPKAIRTLQQALKGSPGNEQIKKSLHNVEELNQTAIAPE
ncbi:MAG: SpoIIE family protein phosphatase [Spirochaetia bacterium]|nr:SpoIIE family protein phosphatase [Spirochaetia bacterium]